MNKNYTNNTQFVNTLYGYILKTNTTAAVDLNNYVLKSDYDSHLSLYNDFVSTITHMCVENALENEISELKSLINVLNDFMNSFEQNYETRLLTDNDLILKYYYDYATMCFNGKIESGLLSIGLGIEHDVDWYITLTFANGKFISVDDNGLYVITCDEKEYYLKLSPNGSQFGKITTIYLELTTINTCV